MDHFTNEDAQVKPAPKAARSMWSPLFIRPSRLASSRAIGIDAEEVFPYLWTFVYTFSMGMSKFFAMA